MSICGKKVDSATKFIDFFVHDILDFSVLNKNDANFNPINSVFDIRDAIDTIIEMQEDKARMKKILVRTRFINFENQPSKYFINTDLKRF